MKKSNTDETKMLHRYWKLLCDFANGKTTDDVLISYFENLRAAFNYSENFPSKALGYFPTKKNTIDSLSDEELKLVEMMRERNKILGSFDLPIPYLVDGYDHTTSMLTINKMDYELPIDSDFIGEAVRIHQNDIHTYVDALNSDGSHCDVDVEKLHNLCHGIDASKTESCRSFDKIETIAQQYDLIMAVHGHLEETQRILKTILLAIVNSDRMETVYESDTFKRLLWRYNNHPKSKHIVVDGGFLKRSNIFPEDYFLSEYSIIYYTGKSLDDTIFNGPLFYCLIECLANSSCDTNKNLIICRRCTDFHFKLRKNEKQQYCSACSRKNNMSREEYNAYQKKYKKHPSRKRKVQKDSYEKKINHLMVNAGKTRGEAEEIVNEETGNIN